MPFKATLFTVRLSCTKAHRPLEKMEYAPVGKAPLDVEAIAEQDRQATLEHFTADDAFEIGVEIRNRLRAVSSKPAVVSIALANCEQLLFQATSRSGTLPTNDIMVSRKRKSALRFGVSTWSLFQQWKGDAEAFAERFGLGFSAGEYCLNGGGVPVRVKGVEGPVAVIVVSGLSQEEDHQFIHEALKKYSVH